MMLFKNSYCLNLKLLESSTMFVFHYILHSYMPRIYDIWKFTYFSCESPETDWWSRFGKWLSNFHTWLMFLSPRVYHLSTSWQEKRWREYMFNCIVHLNFVGFLKRTILRNGTDCFSSHHSGYDLVTWLYLAAKEAEK